MVSAFCRSCQRVTGHKRALGWGTFFAVVLTFGFWLLAIPFYRKRCVICGLLASDQPDSEETSTRWAEYQQRYRENMKKRGKHF